MIDRDTLARMMDGDYDLADKLIRAFREQMAAQSALLAGYLEQGQRPLIENAAHIMKTQSRYLGLEQLAGMAEALEHASTDLPLAQLSDQITELQQEVARVLQTLEDQDARTTS